MCLDFECVRGILLCVEENTGLRKNCFFIDTGLTKSAEWLGSVSDTPEYQKVLMKKYDNDKLIYHINYCIEAGLIETLDISINYKTFVADLTVAGHELVGKIRAPKVWRDVNKGLSSVGSASLSVVSALAEGVASAAIASYLSPEKSINHL